MDEMVKYIFKNMRVTEVRMKRVARMLNSQKHFNNQVVLVAGVFTYSICRCVVEQRKQAARIEKLEKEIEELKNSEGE